MTRIKPVFIIIICLTSSVVFAQKQLELNQQASDSYKNADNELNEIYKQILIEYQSDTIFIKNLKESQRIWIMFRDAELKVKYPEREPGYYGSIYPVCINTCLEQLTRGRIYTLKIWLEGIEEGDVCHGSVKIKQ
jgi:uncharacterized protein YecT (DUF1311 family)